MTEDYSWRTSGPVWTRPGMLRLTTGQGPLLWRGRGLDRQCGVRQSACSFHTFTFSTFDCALHHNPSHAATLMPATHARVSDVPCMFWLHAHTRVTNLILAHTLRGVQHLLHFHLLAFSSLHILWLSHPVHLRHSPASSRSFICPFPPFGILVYDMRK